MIFKKDENNIETEGFSLSFKLIGIFLIIGLIPLITVAFLSLNNAQEGFREEYFAKLKAVEEIKSNQIRSFFDERMADVTVLSESLNVKNTMSELNSVYKEEGVNSPEYNQVISKYDTYLERYTEEYGYYDMFIINLQGDIIYSVAKEDDFNTNLVNGSYSDSNLAEAFQLGKNETSVVDYAYYEPSDAPAIFVSSPIKHSDGRVMGVLALQISDKAINEIMNERAGLGESGETYLVGSDKLMRSNSRFSNEATILDRKIDTVATQEALNGNGDHQIIEDYRGVEVLSSYHKLNIEGLDWAFVAEVDRSEAFATSDNLQTTILWIAAIIAIIIIIVAYFFSKNITNPITKAVGFANEISNGNLAIENINVNKKDEIGVLANSLNKMKKNLSEMVNEVAEIASNLSSSSEELSASSEEISASAEQVGTAIQEVASGAEEQTAQIEETKGNVERLGERIDNVGDKSEVMDDKAENVMKNIKDGNESINNSINQVKEVKNKSSKVSKRIDDLGDLSRKIGDIVELINGISAQTNLLALNAAIEAARAGEAGRGFSVVADEIRELAEESSDATEQIAGLINDIQDGVQDTIEQMDQAENAVEDGVEAIKTTENSFTEIDEAAVSLRGLIEEITEAADEMTDKSDQVKKSVDEIASVSEQASSNAEEVAASSEEQSASTEEIVDASEDLAAMAQKLSDTVDQFNL